MSKVWVKFNENQPIKVDVQDNADIDDLIKAAIDLMKLPHQRQNYVIKYGEVACMRRGIMVTKLVDQHGYGKRDDCPLILDVSDGKYV